MAEKPSMIRWFLEELPKLRESGVITPAIEEDLKSYYTNRLAAVPSPQKYFLLALSIIGGLLITAGTILIFNYNWDLLGKTLQIIVSFIPLTAAFVLSVYTLLKGRSQAWKECSALATAGGAAVVIALLSQIYHVGGDFQDFMMLILFFCIPLIYIFNSVSLTAVYSAFLFSQCPWGRSEIISFVLLCAIQPMILYHLLKADSPYLKAMRYISMVGVVFGLVSFDETGPLAWFTAISLFFLAGLRVYERKESMWWNPWLIFSFIYLTIMLGAASCSGSVRRIDFLGMNHAVTNYLFLGLLLVAFALLLVGDALKKQITLERNLLVVTIFTACFAGTLGFQLMMNILLALFGFVFVKNGFTRRSMLAFNAGFIMFATLLVLRFFDFGLEVLPRAGAFILLGIGFIAANIILSRRMAKEDSSGKKLEEESHV